MVSLPSAQRVVEKGGVEETLRSGWEREGSKSLMSMTWENVSYNIWAVPRVKALLVSAVGFATVRDV